MRRNFSNITICYNLHLDAIDGVTYFNNIHSFLYSESQSCNFLHYVQQVVQSYFIEMMRCKQLMVKIV